LVLDSVTSAPQCIRQPRPRVCLKEGTYHTRLFMYVCMDVRTCTRVLVEAYDFMCV